MNYKFLVAQKGAREHYIIPEIFQSIGCLHSFYTDLYNVLPNTMTNVLSMVPNTKIRKILARRNGNIDKNNVFHVPFYKMLNFNNIHPDQLFAQTVLNKINFDEVNAYFGFTSSSLEIIKAFNERDYLTILDQYDPGRFEWLIVAEEMKRYPHYKSILPSKDIVYKRAEQEWDVAKKIVVNSEWSKQCLIKQGVDARKITIIPLALNLDDMPSRVWVNHEQGPLKIIWLGSANIRKGIHLLIEAAKCFSNEIEIGVYGEVSVALDNIYLPSNIRFYGAIPRSLIFETMAKYDVFVLPTLSDGFAITQLEAQKMGLPAIVSKNCGAVVEQGVNGRVMEDVSVESLKKEISWFLNNRRELPNLSAAAQEKVREFSLQNYVKKLEQIIKE